MNHRHQLFATWAPPESIWSDWAKPILFAHAPEFEPTNSVPPADVDLIAPRSDGHTALILDLPGAAGVTLAPAILRLGYRPVPLYNGAPSEVLRATDPATLSEVVNVRPILRALIAFAPQVRELSQHLPSDAPPAFLLHRDRRTAHAAPKPGLFDNRSVSLPTDFPSASLLLSRGISSVLLIQSAGEPPQADLAHTLLRYQSAGIRLLELSPDQQAGAPRPLHVDTPRWYRSIFQRMLAAFGLIRHSLGGFGGVLPEPSSG